MGFVSGFSKLNKINLSYLKASERKSLFENVVNRKAYKGGITHKNISKEALSRVSKSQAINQKKDLIILFVLFVICAFLLGFIIG